MGLTDILNQYAGNQPAYAPESAPAHFDEVAQSAPVDVLGQGVADAFRADSTPPFGEMVGQMFGKSDPQQQAGLLNRLVHSLGAGVLPALAGGLLSRIAASSPGNVPHITPQQASELTPAEVQEIATKAEQHDPSVLDKVGGFYAEHPQLVKTLGSAALAIALAGVSRRMRA
jgi:hypothetical protein